MKIPLSKLKAMVLYFCGNTDPRFLGKVKLMKLFYFADFIHVKNFGSPITYDNYVRMEHGPIPSVILNLIDAVDGDVDSAELADIIKSANLIEETHKSGKGATVELGSTITVSINGKKEDFNLVGEWEADPKAKKISHESPLGKALIGKAIGEKVEVEAPAGKVLYTIVSIN